MQFKEFDCLSGYSIWDDYICHLISYPTRARGIIVNCYSFQIFAHFWLVKTTRIIHHKQLLLTKNSVILNQWRQRCSPLQIFEPLTSKWRQKCSSLQIIESLTSNIIEPLTEKTWAQGCVIQQREMAASRVYKFERRKYFEWIIKQLLNLAFIGYEEFCRSRRVLSTEAFGLSG